MDHSTIARTITSVLLLGALTACGPDTPRQVRYKADVQPLLNKHCLECHAPGGLGFAASGFSLIDYEGLLAGTRYGPMVVPGDPQSSNLLILIEGRADPSIQMPHGGKKMPAAEIEVLRNWIAQGAPNN